ncbi:P-loop containing nucleoside triphosphate hydrolase protein [Calycina marina]|uniref:RNA helicase n=1 Tax=Calycina marina TaxID=1763456 RepID=A0A9P8CI42_9HELO|nr:P-loop containing nucleoside triphosphate hydrolase protein [Calycina marina]
MKESLEPSASEETAEEKAETVGALQEIVDENAEVVKDEASSTYAENAALTALPRAELDRFLADKFITITDPNKSNLRPITKFEYLPITDDKQLKPFANFKAPTPIQAAAWPFLLAGRDVIGVAETGSGKTMGFAVPCVRAISALPKKMRNMGPRAVIVSPTRELAVQSYDEIKKLTAVCGLEAVCVYGGVPKQEQRKLLKTADIVVATPGRLNDLIIEGFADLSKAAYVVLDEADRMLDKGFEEEIRKIINTTPAIGKRQTLMFTATWPESVRALAATFMQKPVKIAIGDNPSGDLRANTRIMQKVEVVDPRHKEWRLLQLLKEYSAGTKSEDRILVFCLYKKEATRVEIYIKGRGFRVAGIHGDLTQEQRSRALDGFKKGTTPILVATDVAARGLDIPDVQVVINCTFPLTVEDYVHRIGRTGRAGKQGLAITLFTEHDKAQSGALINVLKAANQEVPEELMKFGTTVKKKAHDAYGAFYKDTGDMAKTATKITFD